MVLRIKGSSPKIPVKTYQGSKVQTAFDLLHSVYDLIRDPEASQESSLDSPKRHTATIHDRVDTPDSQIGEICLGASARRWKHYNEHTVGY